MEAPCPKCHWSLVPVMDDPGAYRCNRCGACFRPTPAAAAHATELPSSREPDLGVLAQLAWSICPTAISIFLFFYAIFGLPSLHGEGVANLMVWNGFLGA